MGHLTAVYVAQKADLKLTHIPYNGPMIGDIISGVVDMGSLTASTVMGNIDGGTLRALAVGTDKRLERYPQVPTFKELGFDFSPIAWLAISGPAGMSPELQQHVFEPFFSTKDASKGSGLGLSIVYGIAKHAGGAVTFSSTPGKGTIFEVLLPLARRD